MKVISQMDGSKVVHYVHLLQCQFISTQKADVEMTDKVIEHTIIAMDGIIKELFDENKATYNYLSISGTAYFCAHSSDERKNALRVITVTND